LICFTQNKEYITRFWHKVCPWCSGWECQS